MGTNDFENDGTTRKQLDITAAYTEWLVAVRQACPHSQVFCVTPPFGWHAAEIAAAVTTRTAAGDHNLHLIDTAPIKAGFNDKGGASQLAGDGCHPQIYGQALLGSLVSAEAEKVITPR
jgi:lysophospholipase L1-like esterase